MVIKSSVVAAGSGSYSKGRTAVHEIGHWLNLKHLWGANECGSDEVADTPPQRTYNQGCPSFPKINKSCGDGDLVGEMFMNFMDFTDDACMLMFTSGQVSRMRNLFETGGVRESIMHSLALGEPWNSSSNIVISPANDPSAVQISVHAFPNPAREQIQLDSKGSGLAGKTYTVFSVDGKTMSKGILNGENPKIRIESLPKGMFFIKIGGVNQAIRFIKQ